MKSEDLKASMVVNENDTKTCNKCNQCKPLSEFYKEARCKQGVKPACKKCAEAVKSAYRAKNSESIKKKRIEYNNRPEVTAKRLTYINPNKKINAKRYRIKHKELLAAKRINHQYDIKPKRIRKITVQNNQHLIHSNILERNSRKDKPRETKYTYEAVSTIFKDKGCSLMTTEDEFTKFKDPLKTKVQFITACCKSLNTVHLTNFISKNTGINCKTCIQKQKSEIVKTKDINIGFIIEKAGFDILRETIADEFDVLKTNGGCFSDMIVRPKYMTDNKWLQIQLKITMKPSHGLYSFFVHKSYDGCIMILHCVEDNRTWLINGSIPLGIKQKLNIGVGETSYYKQYEISPSVLAERLHTHYALYYRFRKEYSMIPISIYQQQECEYYAKREKLMPYLLYEYSALDCSKWDLKINGYRVQDKVAISRKHRTDAYFITLYTNNGRVNGKRQFTQYSIGDNDFYWFWLKEHNKFAIVPEQILIDRKAIGGNTKKVLSLTLARRSPYNPYIYSCDDPDLKEKMLGLFTVKSAD
jgi:hypothetical protein